MGFYYGKKNRFSNRSHSVQRLVCLVSEGGITETALNARIRSVTCQESAEITCQESADQLVAARRELEKSSVSTQVWLGFQLSDVAKKHPEVAKLEKELHAVRCMRPGVISGQQMYYKEQSARLKERVKDHASDRRHTCQKNLMTKIHAAYDKLKPHEQEKYKQSAAAQAAAGKAAQHKKILELSQKVALATQKAMKTQQEADTGQIRMRSVNVDPEEPPDQLVAARRELEKLNMVCS